MVIRLAIFIAIALSVAACTPPAITGDFNSPNPASKLHAIRAAGESKDVKNIPNLVQQLDSDDPAVRVFAIHALERITGERLGYNPYSEEYDRRPAVAAWEEAVRTKRFAEGKK